MHDPEPLLSTHLLAGHRPKNSALEVDLDFETTVKPPPQVCASFDRHLNISRCHLLFANCELDGPEFDDHALAPLPPACSQRRR